MKYRYSLTPDDYDQMLAEQDGTCALCPRTPEQEQKALSVDHDHRCCEGRNSCGNCIRGLLCHTCNRALGLLQDDLVRVWKAVLYLKESEFVSE